MSNTYGGRWASNASPSSSSFTYEDLLRTMRSIQPCLPAPIAAIKATLEEFKAAMDSLGCEIRQGGDPMFSPLYGLEVVAEGEHVYVGTPKDLRRTRERWGTLEAARMAYELAERAKGRRPDA